MMKPLTRDILLTLTLKLLLLFALWFVCVKNVEKPHQSTEQWLLGNIPVIPSKTNNSN